MPHEKPHGWSGVPPSRDFAASLKMLSEQLQLKYSQIIAEPMPEEISLIVEGATTKERSELSRTVTVTAGENRLCSRYVRTFHPTSLMGRNPLGLPI